MSQLRKDQVTARSTTGAIIWTAVACLFILAMAFLLLRLYMLISLDTDEGDVEAAAVLERADDAVNSVQLILSFLEGASVLVAVAIGGAAIYGFRQTQELRKEFDDNWALLEARREEMNTSLAEMKSYKPQLDDLSHLIDTLDTTRQKLEQTINDVAFLLQADQEFRLRNYPEAYEFSKQALEHDRDNLLALYITGWMETHHIPGKQDDGIKKLEQAVSRATHLGLKWPSARAAYGVGLRRKGMSMRKHDAKLAHQLLLQAEGELKGALGVSPELVDFNRESYWGTVGGILRDLEQYPSAIRAYENALTVTSGSSYPQGNLAALLLNAAYHEQDATKRKQAEQAALDAFKLTDEFARAELAQAPNDFFLLMDIAMANSVLIRNDAKYKKLAKDFFDRAVQKRVSEELLGVSLRGWQFLINSCPEGNQWDEVRQELEARLKDIQAHLSTRQVADNAIHS